MIVIYKNDKGGFTLRPAYIGFIKNNYVRRILCNLAFPFVLCLTIAINLIQAAFVSVIVIVRAVWFPLSKITLPWKDEIWQRPRTKADSKSKMD